MTLDDIVGETGGGHPRTNYHRLIARAVKGLDSSAEARQLIYERARKALIAHLRFNQPGLAKAVIVKERLALEEAIRNIEAEAAGKSRTRPSRSQRSADDSDPMPYGRRWRYPAPRAGGGLACRASRSARTTVERVVGDGKRSGKWISRGGARSA